MSRSNLNLLINKIRSSSAEVVLNILGGEPTLYPYTKYFIETVVQFDTVKRVALFTNAVREPPEIDSPKYEITPSWHPTECNDDEFLGYVERHISRISQTTVMVPAKYTERARWLIYILKQRYPNMTVEPTPLVVGHRILRIDDTLGGDRSYNLDGKLYTYNEIINLDLNRFKGWQCLMSRFMLSYDGNVTCACMDYRANALTGDFFETLGEIWVTCTRDECIHDCELEMPKYLGN